MPTCKACTARRIFPYIPDGISAPEIERKAAGMNGMYLTDQALDQAALLVSALLITRL
ncbi:hypothetical protein ACFV2U_51045 [Streptomyces sp. NPDC059697]|uniref:hypothetical protein n=1 Tax=Streptomyces sp. NPDC059697 TaxID=3346912 RepID=UPI0036BBE7AD